MRKSRAFNIFREVHHRLTVILGAVAVSLALFIVLPLLQNITKPPETDLFLETVDLGNVEPAPPPLEEKTEQKTETEEQTPELSEAAPPPLDLSQLEMALNPNPDFSAGWMGGGDFTVKLNTITSSSKEDNMNAVFSMADLDQKPQVMYQPGPNYTTQLRRKAPGQVNVIFIVDERGRVVDPRVQNSSDFIFEKPALDAVKRWKFEPGMRGGQSVRFRMLVPITFPKG